MVDKSILRIVLSPCMSCIFGRLCINAAKIIQRIIQLLLMQVDKYITDSYTYLVYQISPENMILLVIISY